MGFFSKLKKISLGGQVAKKLTGSQKDYGGLLEGMMDTPKPQAAVPFDPGQRTGSTINGQSGAPQPSMNLGWTNGGYQYANSPFNQGGKAPQPAPPMSFGGGQPMSPGMGGASGVGAGGMGGAMQPGPPLQGPQPGASMPPAGAQPPMPTGGSFRIPEQAALIAGLRGR